MFGGRREPVKFGSIFRELRDLVAARSFKRKDAKAQGRKEDESRPLLCVLAPWRLCVVFPLAADAETSLTCRPERPEAVTR